MCSVFNFFIFHSYEFVSQSDKMWSSYLFLGIGRLRHCRHMLHSANTRNTVPVVGYNSRSQRGTTKRTGVRQPTATAAKKSLTHVLSDVLRRRGHWSSGLWHQSRAFHSLVQVCLHLPLSRKRLQTSKVVPDYRLDKKASQQSLVSPWRQCVLPGTLGLPRPSLDKVSMVARFYTTKLQLNLVITKSHPNAIIASL